MLKTSQEEEAFVSKQKLSIIRFHLSVTLWVWIPLQHIITHSPEAFRKQKLYLCSIVCKE